MSSLNRYNLPSTEPFLNLQKNAIIRRLSTAYDLQEPGKVHLYKKPSYICKHTDEALPLLWKDKIQFAQDWMQQIEQHVSCYHLSIKSISNSDTTAIQEFLHRRYPPQMAQEICAFDLFRFRQFGHGIILRDKEEKVQGCIFEVGYDTLEKTSYTLRLAIAEEWKGKRLGWHLMMYSCLKAMEQGSRVKRGIIQYDNLASLHINLNKVGWICDRFEPAIEGLGAFFHIALPLDPPGLTGNVIDFDRCKEFIETQKAGSAYRLIDCEDFDGIAKMYASTPFKISAFLKAGQVHEKAMFLAIPAEDLQMDFP